MVGLEREKGLAQAGGCLLRTLDPFGYAQGRPLLGKHRVVGPRKGSLFDSLGSELR